jgi:hypothetical protein
MHELIFYPIGNGECCLIKLECGKLIAFDYADLHNPNDDDDKRMPLKENFRDDIGWNANPKRDSVDVLAVTHGDLDHIKRISEHFWLEHASKYQGADRIKFTEMWVPAALIVEEGVEDETRVIRAEARHRFLAKAGIRVFSRPAALKNWLESKGKRLDDYRHLCCDAGTLVPTFSKAADGVEFFVHSPFAERTADGLLDRNSDCIVVQAVFVSGGRETRAIISGDICNQDGELDRIVRITRHHGREERLNWDILDIPHHCSYLSMGAEKGDYKTPTTSEVDWLLKNGNRRSVMVCSSWEIPSETTDQPPHVETYRTYQDYRRELDAEWRVTMEYPTRRAPRRTVVEVGYTGARLVKQPAVPAAAATIAPRVG